MNSKYIDGIKEGKVIASQGLKKIISFWIWFYIFDEIEVKMLRTKATERN